MSESIRTQKIARMLQKALGEIFLQEASRLFGNVLITVTEVRVSPDLSLAKVYLSFTLNEDKADLLANIARRKGAIRKELAHRVGKKIRRVPELDFYTDHSVEHAARMNQLLAELDLPEG
ncbi:MAG: 30S ribosome-binding factor RbfA [Roseivirga sp.]